MPPKTSSRGRGQRRGKVSEPGSTALPVSREEETQVEVSTESLESYLGRRFEALKVSVKDPSQSKDSYGNYEACNPFNIPWKCAFDDIKTGDVLEITALRICSPKELYVVLTKDVKGYMDFTKFMTALHNKHYHNKILIPPMEKIMPGSIIACRHGGIWSRCRVDQINPETATYLVQDCDNASVFEVRTDDCMYLHGWATFQQRVALAGKIKAVNLEQYWKKIIQVESLDAWDQAEMENLHNGLTDRSFYAQFLMQGQSEKGEHFWKCFLLSKRDPYWSGLHKAYKKIHGIGHDPDEMSEQAKPAEENQVQAVEEAQVKPDKETRVQPAQGTRVQPDEEVLVPLYEKTQVHSGEETNFNPAEETGVPPGEEN